MGLFKKKKAWAKPSTFANMEHIFTDSNGKRYYKYQEDDLMALPRLAALQEAFTELQTCFTVGETDSIIETMIAAHDAIIHPVEGQPGGLAMLGFCLEELKMRRQNYFRADLMFKIAAIIYIREDESPITVDSALLDEKIEQFKKDSASEGCYAFFYGSSLRDLLPSMITSEVEFQQYYQEAIARATATKTIIEQYLSATGSRNKGKTAISSDGTLARATQ